MTICEGKDAISPWQSSLFHSSLQPRCSDSSREREEHLGEVKLQRGEMNTLHIFANVEAFKCALEAASRTWDWRAHVF